MGGDRKCTDILFLLLLFLAWFAMTVLGFIVTGAIPNGSLEPGDPRRLINGIDYDGRICGVNSEVKVLIIHCSLRPTDRPTDGR